MMRRAPTLCRSDGFTLLELVVAITVGAIVLMFAAMLVTAPIDAYTNQSGRSALTDSATNVAQRMEQDLRSALPNSVSITNVGSRSIIEMLVVEQVVFYRGPSELGVALLEFSFAADADFTTLGRFDPNAAGTYTLNNRYVVVGNIGRSDPSRDAYHLNSAPGVIVSGAQVQVTPSPTNEERVNMLAPYSFQDPTLAPADPLNPARVVRNRIFLVRHPVTYICNAAANARSVRRYEAYSINPGIATAENSAELTGAREALLADNVGGCQVRCGSGAATEAVCRDTLSVQIDFDRPDAAGDVERVRLHREFDMDNDL